MQDLLSYFTEYQIDMEICQADKNEQGTLQYINGSYRKIKALQPQYIKDEIIQSLVEYNGVAYRTFSYEDLKHNTYLFYKNNLYRLIQNATDASIYDPKKWQEYHIEKVRNCKIIRGVE